MNSTVTIMQPNGLDDTNSISQKLAKVSTTKSENIRKNARKYMVKSVEPVSPNEVKSFSGHSFHAKDTETAEKLRNVGYTNAYKTFLNKMNMQIAQYGHAVVRLQGARKIKIVPKLKNQTSKLRDESDELANQVSNDMNTNVFASIPQQEEVSNIRAFQTSRVLATPEYNRNESVNKEPVSNVNNMYSFATGKPIMETTTEVNNNVTHDVANVNNNLSRSARMDYNTNMMAKEEPKEVKQTPVHTDIYSTTEYVQQKNAANSSNGNVLYFEEEKEKLEAARARKIQMENMKNELLEKVRTKEEQAAREIAMETRKLEDECNGMTIEITNLRERLQAFEEEERRRKMAR